MSAAFCPKGECVEPVCILQHRNCLQIFYSPTVSHTCLSLPEPLLYGALLLSLSIDGIWIVSQHQYQGRCLFWILAAQYKRVKKRIKILSITCQICKDHCNQIKWVIESYLSTKFMTEPMHIVLFQVVSITFSYITLVPLLSARRMSSSTLFIATCQAI